MERVIACIALVVLTPVFAVVAAVILVSLGRPVLFRQHRVTQGGREFEMVKFRTLPCGGDLRSAGSRRASGAALIRRFSLDELPQLVNVVHGDMALIGPRPERPELAAAFARQIEHYDKRHRVAAGITGWAQVLGIGRGPDRFTNGALTDRVECDNYYIDNWSPGLDARILARSVRAIMQYRQPAE